MIRFSLLPAACLALLVTAAGCVIVVPDKPFGAPMKISRSEAIPIEEVLASPEAHDGKYIRMSGTVADVCANKGCWMELGSRDSDETVFVKFTCPVEGRLIPMEAVGHSAEVEGTLTIVEISAREARHYASESNEPQKAAEIEGPQFQMRMAAPAARIEGLDIE